MAWAALLENRVLIIRWMDEPHQPRTVTAESYQHMLKEEVWVEVRARAARKKWWWQQDGASDHCTDDVIDFLNDKFK